MADAALSCRSRYSRYQCSLSVRNILGSRNTPSNLQFRPTLELKETLLHEMIHAWMFLEKIRDTGDHGQRFQERMNFINRATFHDNQASLVIQSSYYFEL